MNEFDRIARELRLLAADVSDSERARALEEALLALLDHLSHVEETDRERHQMGYAD